MFLCHSTSGMSAPAQEGRVCPARQLPTWPLPQEHGDFNQQREKLPRRWEALTRCRSSGPSTRPSLSSSAAQTSPYSSLRLMPTIRLLLIRIWCLSRGQTYRVLQTACTKLSLPSTTARGSSERWVWSSVQ